MTLICLMKLTTAAVALSLLLAGCDKSDPRICGSLAMKWPVGMPVSTTEDQVQVTFACVERWAARFAKGPDSPYAVARAAVAACDGAIEQLTEMAKKPGSVDYTDYQDKAWWRDRAMFIAVQTRAGNCYPDA